MVHPVYSQRFVKHGESDYHYTTVLSLEVHTLANDLIQQAMECQRMKSPHK